MSEKKIEIVAIATSDFQENSFVVILKETVGKRRIPVVIGTLEAQAIVVAIQNIASNRPLTHDLFMNTIIAMGGHLQKIVIAELREGIFYSTIYIKKEDGTIETLDSRTSDALALAVRFRAPLYTTNKVLEDAGVVMGDEDDDDIYDDEEVENTEEQNKYSSLSVDELESKLQQFLEEEAYEQAAEIRDELNRRA